MERAKLMRRHDAKASLYMIVSHEAAVEIHRSVSKEMGGSRNLPALGSWTRLVLANHRVMSHLVNDAVFLQREVDGQGRHD